MSLRSRVPVTSAVLVDHRTALPFLKASFNNYLFLTFPEILHVFMLYLTFLLSFTFSLISQKIL